MSGKKKNAGSAGPAAPLLDLRLYVAGRAPNSVSAIANLDAICREYTDGQYRLEIIDVLENPKRALTEGVLVTPTLIKLSPGPADKLVGNLSDKSKTLLVLGLKEKIS